MSLSTLCVIGVVIVFYTDLSSGQKTCRDCVPFIYCREAKHLAETDKSATTKQLFKDAHCGFHNNIAKVCCSDFDAPKLSSRWNMEQKHPNIGLLPDSCGKITLDRIIGGVEASLYEFPWMVIIAYGDKPTFGCSGTLINSRYVLTAAHCVVNKDIKGVRIGDYNLNEDIDCQGNICEKITQDREVETDIVHEDYEWSSYSNDIALLRLKTPVILPLKNADTICLPTTQATQEYQITNKQATVAGWGLTEYGKQFTVLRKVLIPVRATDVCQDYYSHISDPESTQFCAGIFGKDSCRGDSGGPLMIDAIVQDELRVVQYGIVSSGPQECGSNYPGLYTDVRKYVNWILDNIKE